MPHHDRRREIRAEISLLFVVLVWAANYPLAKYCLAGMDIFIFNAIRFVVAPAVVLGMFLRKAEWTPVNKADWKRLLEAGFIMHVIYQIAFVFGLSMTTAGNSAVLLSTSPLWIVIFYSRMHKETIRSGVWIGMAISFIGVIMIVIGSGKKLHLGGNELIGDLISLTAAVLWALSSNLQKPLLAKYSAMQLALVMLTVGGVGLIPMAIPAAIHTDWGAIGWQYYAGAALSGAFSIGIGNAVWSYGIKHLGPGRTGIFSNLTPVAAFILSYLTLHEQLVPVQVFGAALTIVGVWIVRR